MTKVIKVVRSVLLIVPGKLMSLSTVKSLSRLEKIYLVMSI